MLVADGRARIRLESRKKPEGRKMPEKAANPHLSTARFVSPLLGWKTTQIPFLSAPEILFSKDL